jgi:hypothetical protein
MAGHSLGPVAHSHRCARRVPLAPLGKVLQEQVRCAYSDNSFSLLIHTDKGYAPAPAPSLPHGGVSFGYGEKARVPS